MKKIIFSFICLLMIMLITGCGITKEEKQKRQAYYAQAEKNAIKYIEKKYGFTPEIKRTECTFGPDFDLSCNDEIMVYANYKEKSFRIMIDGSKQTEEGIDNYQYDEITKDLLAVVEKYFGKSHKYQIEYGKKEDYQGLTDIYYNGSNLFEITDSPYCTVLAEYINGDNFKIQKDKLELDERSLFYRLTIINHKSLSSYKKIKKNGWELERVPNSGELESYIKDNSKYLKEVIVISKYDNRNEYHNFQ